MKCPACQYGLIAASQTGGKLSCSRPAGRALEHPAGAGVAVAVAVGDAAVIRVLARSRVYRVKLKENFQ